MTLTEKEKAFCEAYVSNGYNATRAYMIMNPTSTEKNAGNRGCIYLKRPEVRQYIYDIQKDRIAEQMIDADRVLLELSQMAFAEKGDADYTASVKLKALDLIQKQLSLQNQKIDANISGQVIITDDYSTEN